MIMYRCVHAPPSDTPWTRRMKVWMPIAVLLAGCTKPEVIVDSSSGDTATDAVSPCAKREHPGNTVGIQFCRPGTADGYTLFSPNRSGTTYLIDVNGDLVHEWQTNYYPGHAAYFLENGNLLRTAQDNPGTRFMAGGGGGRVLEYDWDGNVVWDFAYNTDEHFLHHDVELMPSGNILMLAWEYFDRSAAIEAGRDPGNVDMQGVWVDHIIEVDPTSDAIVWEWHLFDHLVQDVDPTKGNFGVIADNPDKIDFNLTTPFGGPLGGMNPDWNHINGIDYNAELDQIIVSSHNQDELWIIDKVTGSIVYRWGKPANYGAPGDQRLSAQHDPEWIDPGLPGEGDIIIFNNGLLWGNSSAMQFAPPIGGDGSYPLTPGEAWGPQELTWIFEDPGEFFSTYVSGVNRLPSGNTMICEGATGRLFEVTDAGEVVWEYINPVTSQGPLAQGDDPGDRTSENGVFRADKFLPEYPGFAGRDLTPQGPIER